MWEACGKWEDAVAAALKPSTSAAPPPPPPRTLTLDGAVKCSNGRLPRRRSSSGSRRSSSSPSPTFASARSRGSAPPAAPAPRPLRQPRRRRARRARRRGLAALRHLDLSNNRIAAAEDLAPLAALGLESLDLYECPVTRVEGYRSKVFGMIPSLKYLDKIDADGKERLIRTMRRRMRKRTKRRMRRRSTRRKEEDEEEEEEEEEDGRGVTEKAKTMRAMKKKVKAKSLMSTGKIRAAMAPHQIHTLRRIRGRGMKKVILNGKSNESSRPLNTTSG
uniref:Uncharacterized protein n=1 Tax=Ananas comosus var. bracteatus TaxID=296719 RepID=A0A6V7NLU1_ANACO|nr:unnamed protein product [Ananas comosus var. bracteatus]